MCTCSVPRLRRDLGASQRGASLLPSVWVKTSALATRRLSELSSAARALPVYASQPRSPSDHATLGSGRALPLYRTGLVPLGPTEGFCTCFPCFLPLQTSLAHYPFAPF